jgi:hypothetical protein
MPYFENYDYAVLKEKFVQSRFAELYWPDTDAALWALRKNGPEALYQISDQAPDRLDELMERKNILEIMRECASPISREVLPQVLGEQGNEEFLSLLPFLRPEVELFAEGDTVTILLPASNEARCIAGMNELHPLNSVVVFYVLFEEWKRHAPRWKKARKFICDLVTEDLQIIRNEAEKEFDEAIAVSEDGKKIVHAEKVIVWNSSFIQAGSPGKIYSEGDLEFFRKNKVVRSLAMVREMRLPSLFDFLPTTQVFVDSDREGTIFYTHRQFCPPDLPEPSK